MAQVSPIRLDNNGRDLLVYYNGKTSTIPVSLITSLKNLKILASALGIKGLSSVKAADSEKITAAIRDHPEFKVYTNTKPISNPPKTTPKPESKSPKPKSKSPKPNFPTVISALTASYIPFADREEMFAMLPEERADMLRQQISREEKSAHANHWIIPFAKSKAAQKHVDDDMYFDPDMEKAYLLAAHSENMAALQKISKGMAQWGDLVTYNGDPNNYRNDGLVVFNGQKLVQLDSKIDDYKNLPMEFTVLGDRNIPLDYWHNLLVKPEEINGRVIAHNGIVWIDMPDERKQELLRNEQPDGSTWFMYRGRKINVLPYWGDNVYDEYSRSTGISKPSPGAKLLKRPLKERIAKHIKIEKSTRKTKMFVLLENEAKEPFNPSTVYI